MAGDTQFFIGKEVQQRLLDECKRQVLTTGQGTQSGKYDGFNHRDALVAIDKEYYRDNIYTYDKIQAGRANRMGDKKKLQDVVVPIMESQTETMLAYCTSVFLTGNPLFGVTADPANMTAAKMYQAILSDHASYGNWTAELLTNMHNAFKYFSVLEVSWCREKMFSPEAEVDANGKVQDTQKTTIWQGNKVRNISPYNFFWDRRVPITKVSQYAEYAGYVDLDSRTKLKTYIENRGLKMNIAKAYEASLGNPQVPLYYVPDFLWDSMDNLSGMKTFAGNQTYVDDFSTWATDNGGKAKVYKNIYYRVTRYMRIVPIDFGMDVPMRNQVQIWKIVTVNDEVIIECERQNNNHNLIPLLCCQPVIDGLEYNSRSFAQKQIPIQDIGSSLLNAALDSQRRKISDRMLYDPSRVSEKNIASTSPTARIPVKPSAYGKPVQDAVYKIPYEDNQTAGFMATAREIFSFGDMISGQNKAQQGQFVKGNKTQAEYEDVQNKSSGRQQKVALMIEAQLMQPLKLIIKSNVLQYQPSGELFNYADQKNIQIDPQELRKGMFTYTITDGMEPEDKVIHADALQGFLQLILGSPYLQSKYQLEKVVSYFAKTQNADLTPFEVTPQIAQQNLQQMTAAGLTPGTAKQPVPPQAGVQ